MPLPDDPKPLDATQLCASCDPSAFDFKTTAEVTPLEGWLGQERALDAIKMAAEIRHHDFNLFVLGNAGSGRRAAARELINQVAAKRTAARDWVYVNNFNDPQKPIAISFDHGQGAAFRTAMQVLIDDLASDIPALFESDDYQTRRQAIEETYSEQHETAMNALVERAKERGAAVLRTPMGLVVAAMRDGEVLTPEVFEDLPKGEREKIEAVISEIQGELESILKEVPKQQKKHRAEVENLHVDLMTEVVDTALTEVLGAFRDLPKVSDHITAVRKDLIENAELFLLRENGAQAGAFPMATTQQHLKPQYQRYAVNLIVSAPDKDATAPVVEEDLPSLGNLIGRIEHVSQMGALVTNFTMIRAGAFHRANGGFLILDARQILTEPLSWDALKRCLRTREVAVFSAADRYSLMSTVSLEPDPIPLDLRVVLIGDRTLFFLLSALDPDFATLFKVQADFNDEVPRDTDAMQVYTSLIAALVAKSEIRPLSADGVGAILSESTRMAGDAERLTLNVGLLTDLLREADFWANRDGADTIGAVTVARAIAERDRRADRIPTLTQDAIIRETVLIDTKGTRVGQINALSVIEIGGHRFGRPSRVTARVRMGSGKVVDIEREADLGGPLHSKGMMILQGYLATHYSPDYPLSLWASIVFEQSYGGVDGDSASAGELMALLSAISEIPIGQNYAVTGSVNQFGDVQAIGGVNEKIEGFFDICAARGLTGDQGVLIPAANIKHLALRNRVIDAVRDGKFQIIPFATIEQGLKILTGKPAGQRRPNGTIPKYSLNAAVEARLESFAKARKIFAAKPDDKGGVA